MPPQRARLRKREIAFALAMGGLAAGGAALVLEAEDSSPAPLVAMEDRATFDVAPFEEISTIGPQDVVIVTGDSYSVRSEGSPRAIAQLEAVVEDDRLVIRPRGDFARGFDWSSLSGATFYVTTPRLDAISLAGSGSVRIDKVEGGSFTGSIAGPGELAIATLDVDEVDFRIGGSGNVSAAGTAREALVSIGGSGAVRAGGLLSQTASVSIGGSGDVALTVEEEAQVSIAGSGDVDISGPGRCSVSRMGSGTVRCSGGGGDTN
jgi:hypothetical protein